MAFCYLFVNAKKDRRCNISKEQEKNLFSLAKVHFVFLFLLGVMEAQKEEERARLFFAFSIVHRESEWCVTHGKKERKRKVIEEEIMDGYRRGGLLRTQKNGKDEKISMQKKERGR